MTCQNCLVCPSLPAAGQLSQSAHFSLQLPYTVLGLGRSANFLDHLFVGIPRQPGETVRKYERVILPGPRTEPQADSRSHRMFEGDTLIEVCLRVKADRGMEVGVRIKTNI